MTNPFSSYAQNTINGAGKGDQVAMLLNRAAQHMQTMKTHIDASEYEASNKASEKATDIVVGLMGWLSKDIPEAQSVVATLENYYLMLLDLISKACIRNDISLCDSAIKSMNDMAAMWRQIERQFTQPNGTFDESQVSAAI